LRRRVNWRSAAQLL